MAAPPRRGNRAGLGGVTAWVSDAALNGYPLVDTPMSCSMPATMPLVASKNSGSSLSQPPRLSIVKTFDGSVNLDLFFSNTDLTTGR